MIKGASLEVEVEGLEGVGTSLEVEVEGLEGVGSFEKPIEEFKLDKLEKFFESFD